MTNSKEMEDLNVGDEVYSKEDDNIRPAFIRGKRGIVKSLAESEGDRTWYVVDFGEECHGEWAMWRDEIQKIPNGKAMMKKTKAWTNDDWRYECPHCGQYIEDHCEEKARQVKCPGCEEIFIVEEPDRKEGVEDGKTCTLTWRKDGTALADCSNCGEGQLYDDYNYCPNCGARNIDTEDEPPEIKAGSPCPECGKGWMHLHYDDDGNAIEFRCPKCHATVAPPTDLDGKVTDDRKCPRCGATWPFGETDRGTLKHPRCPSCGCGIAWRKEEPEILPEGVVYKDTDSMLMLFCNKCNKIIKDPVWDEGTQGPHCPECKTTLIEKSPVDIPPNDEPERPEDPIEDPNNPGSWINPNRGKIPSTEESSKHCPRCGEWEAYCQCIKSEEGD